MKNIFILFSVVFIIALSSCNYFYNSPQQQDDVYIPLNDTTTKDNNYESDNSFFDDSSSSAESQTKENSAPHKKNVTPVFENGKRIGRIVEGQFIPRKDASPEHDPEYYESEYAK